MQTYIDHALENFRPVFSRSSTWLLFCAIVMGFMGAGEIIGVTSLCRFWLLDADGYDRLLHFFRLLWRPIEIRFYMPLKANSNTFRGKAMN